MGSHTGEDFCEPERSKFIDELANCLEEGSLALFAGAGFTMSAGFPSWSQLLDDTATQAGCQEMSVAPPKSMSDMAEYAQFVANRGRIDDLKKNIAEDLKKREIGDSELLEAVKGLNLKKIWTTNYDHVIEEKIATRPKDIDVFYRERDLIKINDAGNAELFKIHGDVDDQDSIIITKSELEEERRLMMTFLKRDLVAYNFLFIGYSFSDQVILQQLSDIRTTLKSGMRKHYAIIYEPASNDEKGIQRQNYIKCKINDLYLRYYIASHVVHEEHEIASIVREARAKARERHVFISGSLAAHSPDAKQFCYRLAAELMNSKLNLKIHTGLGNLVGSYLAFGILSSERIGGNMEKFGRHCVMWPFAQQLEMKQKKSDLDDKEQLEQWRKTMLSMCDFAIFIFGQSSSSKNNEDCMSEGVQQEFAIAKEAGLRIIPVGATEYQARKIWDEVKGDIDSNKPRDLKGEVIKHISQWGNAVRKKWEKTKGEIESKEKRHGNAVRSCQHTCVEGLLKAVVKTFRAIYVDMEHSAVMQSVSSPCDVLRLLNDEMKRIVMDMTEGFGLEINTLDSQVELQKIVPMALTHSSLKKSVAYVTEPEREEIIHFRLFMEQTVVDFVSFVNGQWTQMKNKIEEKGKERSYSYLRRYIDKLGRPNRSNKEAFNDELAKTVVQIIQECIHSSSS